MPDVVRPSVHELVELGPMPTDEEADSQPVRAMRWEQLLGALYAEGNLTDSEARRLLPLFPADDSDSYGVAWTLVHVIESAPSWPIADALQGAAGPWADLLRQRASATPPSPDR